MYGTRVEDCNQVFPTGTRVNFLGGKKSGKILSYNSCKNTYLIYSTEGITIVNAELVEKHIPHWGFVVSALKQLEKTEKEVYDTAHSIQLSPESPLLSNTDMELVKALELLIGDDTEMLGWFVWENDFGKRGLSVTIDNKTIIVKNYEDLKQCI